MTGLNARSLRVAAGVAGLVAVLGAVSPAGAQSLLSVGANVIAASGQDVPGLTGVTFGGISTFDSPVLDENGSVLFRGRMVGMDVMPTNERALFRGSSAASLSMLIRGGDAAPGIAGANLNTATASGIGSGYRLSPSGQTMWGSSLSGTSGTTTDTAIFGGFAGSLVKFVQEGDAAPGTMGATFSSSFSSPSQQNTSIDRAGRILFKSNLLGGDVSGTTNNEGWFYGMPGSLAMMVRKGDDVASGATAASLGFVSQTNMSGQVLFDLTLGGTAIADNNSSVWVHTPGAGNSLVLREGDAAPGTVGATFGVAGGGWTPGIGGNAFNSDGRFVFTAPLLGGDVVAGDNDRGTYVGSAGGHTLVMRRGEAAPGTDGLFDVVNNSGQALGQLDRVVLQSSLRGGTVGSTDDTGIWAGTPGALELVAREGGVAPGITDGTFGSMTGQAMLTNALGQVVFNNSVLTPTGSVTAMFAWDPSAGLMLLAAVGDEVEVAPGVFKAVTGLGSVGFTNSENSSLSLGNDGTVAIRLSFANNEGAIVTVRVVPAPAGIAPLAVLGLLASRRRRAG
ncbi:MAG: hypothetical protein R3B68_16910 [Phycisphaerales bacterium]